MVVGPPGALVADDADLAPTSPVAWRPDDEVGDAEEPGGGDADGGRRPDGPTSQYPWESEPLELPGRGDYLDDVDPSVANPFPWTPDDD